MIFKKLTVAETLADPRYSPLWHEYIEEAGYTAYSPEPDFRQYEAIEKQGIFDITGVYSDDGKMIGFFTFILNYLPHAKGQLLATVESLFLEKSERKGAAGLKLLKALKARATELGASTLLIGTRAGSRTEKVVERLGLEKQNTVWAAKL